MKDIYDILREWKKRRAEKCQPSPDFALATLIRGKGSTYARRGARMPICEDGKTVGSLRAGCLEEEVALRARQVLLTGEPALMSFDTRKHFGCAGKIDIFIECAAFFFSSRRRHTRLQGDWSSDVCSSDLYEKMIACGTQNNSEKNHATPIDNFARYNDK